MAIAEAQAWVIGSGTTSATATYGATPTQGNLMLAVAKGTSAFANVSLSGWTLVEQAFGNSATTGPFALWYKIAGASEPTGVTVTWTSSASTTLSIGEYLGTNLTPGKSNSINSNGATSTTKNTGDTDVTDYSYKLCVAVIGFNGALGTITWNNSFTQRIITTNTVVATKIVNNRGIFGASPTHTVARVGGGIIATFAGKDQHGLLGML